MNKELNISTLLPEGNHNLDDLLKKADKMFQANYLTEAEFLYRIILQHWPDNYEAYLGMGFVFKAKKQLGKAVEMFEKAVTINPWEIRAWSMLGRTASELKWFSKSENAFKKITEMYPHLSPPHINRLSALIYLPWTETLRSALKTARNQVKEQPRFGLAAAELANRDGDCALALKELKFISTNKLAKAEEILYTNLLGKIYDMLGHTDLAFEQFVNLNTLDKKLQKSQNFDKNTYLQHIENYRVFFNKYRIQSWIPQSNEETRTTPVFLVGFPRSGTTLLNTILRSHPSVDVADEPPTALYIRSEIEKLPISSQNNFPNLEKDQLGKIRDKYYQLLEQYLETDLNNAPPVVVDKLPLRSVEAGLLISIFPQAKFIFAVRHPCDCVLSCFMNRFGINNAMANFFDLSDAAVLYHRTLSLWNQHVNNFKIPVHYVYYENIVYNFNPEIESLLNFLDLDWDSNITDFARTAAQKGQLNTPSTTQVSQGLYKHASYRWQKYCKKMQPIIPVLEPWIKFFGYEANSNSKLQSR